MAKKVIQVPVDERLLKELDVVSKRQRRTRSELIREACHRYLQEMELEELDRRYREGYLRVPEEPETAEAQIALSAELMNTEPW